MLKSILNCETPSSDILYLKTKDAQFIHEPIDIMDEMDNFYTEWFQDKQTAQNDEILKQLYSPITSEHIELCRPITFEELFTTLNQMAKKKSPGPSGIFVEHFLYSGEQFLNLFLCLLNLILKESICPKKWCQSLLTVIPKCELPLGDLKKYRPITLVEVPKKILMKILTKRFQKEFKISNSLCGENFGYVEGISTQDAASSLKAMIDDAKLSKTPLYISKLDARKAFDSVPFSAISLALKRVGVPSSLIRLFSYLMDQRYVRIITYFGLTKGFKPKCGIEQGGMESPLLWVLILEPLLNKLKNLDIGYKLESNGNTPLFVNNITYVDDINLIASSIQDLDILIEQVESYLSLHGILLNLEKTEIIHNCYTIDPPEIFRNIKLSCNSEFSLLGVAFNVNGKYPKDLVMKKIEAIEDLLNDINRKNLPKNLHKYILNSILLPRLTYLLGVQQISRQHSDHIEKIFKRSICVTNRVKLTTSNSLIYHSMMLNYNRPSTVIRTSSLKQLLKAKNSNFKSTAIISICESRMLTKGCPAIPYLSSAQKLSNYNGQILHDSKLFLQICNCRLLYKEQGKTLSKILGEEYPIYRKLLFRCNLFFLYDIWDKDANALRTSLNKNFKSHPHSVRIIQIIKNYLKNSAQKEIMTNRDLLSASKASVWTDGSLDPDTGRLGTGILIQLSNDEEVTEERHFSLRIHLPNLRQSSTLGELAAIALALNKLSNNMNVAVYTDSMSAIKILTSNEKHWLFQNPLAETVRAIIDRKNLQVEFIKVAAHTGIAENEFVDHLAKSSLTLEDYADIKQKIRRNHYLLLIEGTPVHGNIIKEMKIYIEMMHLERSHKRDILKTFLDNLPNNSQIRETIVKKVFPDNHKALLKFNISRLTRELPIKSTMNKWYGDTHSPNCDQCGNIETHEHFFNCPAKSNVVSRLLNNLTTIGKTYTKKFSLTREVFTKAISNGYFQATWLNSLTTLIEAELRIPFINAIMNIITIDCHKAFWKNFTSLG